MTTTGTANVYPITVFSPRPVRPEGTPALPDCGVVLGWVDDQPVWRWETLEERDARLHEEWYRERAEKRWGYAHKKKE